MKLVDISKFKKINRFKVTIDGKETDLQIGDKLIFPDGCPIIKTVISMTIFEDKSVNYLLKWYDEDGFKQEAVSLTDLKLLNVNVLPRTPITLSNVPESSLER